MTQRLVSYLRAQAATPPFDERLPLLVGNLSGRSSRFAELWARQEVGAVSSGVNRLEHPSAGTLEVNFERLCFAGIDYPVIIFYHAEPGSQSETALARLFRLRGGRVRVEPVRGHAYHQNAPLRLCVSVYGSL